MMNRVVVRANSSVRDDDVMASRSLRMAVKIRVSSGLGSGGGCPGVVPAWLLVFGTAGGLDEETDSFANSPARSARDAEQKRM
jgi:hypothetical protein